MLKRPHQHQITVKLICYQEDIRLSVIAIRIDGVVNELKTPRRPNELYFRELGQLGGRIKHLYFARHDEKVDGLYPHDH